MTRYGSECRIPPRHEYNLKQLRLLSNNYKSDSRERSRPITPEVPKKTYIIQVAFFLE